MSQDPLCNYATKNDCSRSSLSYGILLFLTALDMLFQRRSKRRENQTENELIDDPSVFPLAIPLITGPGAIATVILIAGSKPGLMYLLGF